MAPWLAPSLAQLRSQILAKWTLPKGVYIGWIGDTAHASRASQHNPDGDGSVDAIDVPHVPSIGLDAHRLAREAIADPRCQLVISNRQIWSRARASEGWRTYTGSSPHTAHAHIETTDAGQMDTSVWRLPIFGPTTPTASTPPAEEADDMTERYLQVNEDPSRPGDWPKGAILADNSITVTHLSGEDWELVNFFAQAAGTPVAVQPINQVVARHLRRRRIVTPLETGGTVGAEQIAAALHGISWKAVAR